MFNLYYKDKDHTSKTKPTTQIITLKIDKDTPAELFIEAGSYLMSPFTINDLQISPPSAIFDMNIYGTFVSGASEVKLSQTIIRNGSDAIIFHLAEKDKLLCAYPVRIVISTTTVTEQTLYCYIDVRQ